MLSKEQKNEIIEEEKFRHEIREQLKDQIESQSKNKVVTFLNTNLGLFLLSTIFISFFTWAYNKFEFMAQEKRIIERKSEQLKVELLNRFNYVGKIATKYHGEERAMIRTAIFGLNGGNYNSLSPIPAYSPIYQEFKERSIISLLTELNEINPNVTIDSLISFSNKLPIYFWSTTEQTGVDSNYYDLSDSMRPMFVNEYNYYNKELIKVVKK